MPTRGRQLSWQSRETQTLSDPELIDAINKNLTFLQARWGKLYDEWSITGNRTTQPGGFLAVTAAAVISTIVFAGYKAPPDISWTSSGDLTPEAKEILMENAVDTTLASISAIRNFWDTQWAKAKREATILALSENELQTDNARNNLQNYVKNSRRAARFIYIHDLRADIAMYNSGDATPSVIVSREDTSHTTGNGEDTLGKMQQEEAELSRRSERDQAKARFGPLYEDRVEDKGEFLRWFNFYEKISL